MKSAQLKLSWKSSENSTELNQLLKTLSEEYPLCENGRGLKLKFRRISGNETISNVIRTKGEVLVEYTSLSAAARGIGSALSRLDGKNSTPFHTLGIMLDVSRGMVMTVEYFKKWLRRLALSGYNQLMLYCEDIYELENEPFFGAYRGAYSLEELQELDRYAKTLGVEMVGCIQTLAHLEQILRHDVYKNIADTERVMMVGNPDVAVLVEKMIAFWSQAFTSRRIHIGMDEAHGLGRGNRETLKGPANGFDLMNEHIRLISGICEKYSLKPMMWSDMFFRLTNEAHNYYDTASPFPAGLAENIDPAMELVYWDYYHENSNIYRDMIRRHRELGKEPVVASGIWTWARLWYDHDMTMRTALPCIEACRDGKVRELFFTMWGDDGAYCEYDSALAGAVRCSDLSFGETDEQRSAKRFAALCNADYYTQIAPGDITRYTIAPEGKPIFDLCAPMLLWDDPLLGIYFDTCKRINPEFDLETLDIYDNILCRIIPDVESDEAGSISYAVNLFKFLMLKLELRGALEAAYDSGDRLSLRELASTTIPAALNALRALDTDFRKCWLKKAKPFGLEQIQLRNAGQAARLEELARRICELLDGKTDFIAELETRLPWSAPSPYYSRYKSVSAGSLMIQ